jgi:hypothetical protein
MYAKIDGDLGSIIPSSARMGNDRKLYLGLYSGIGCYHSGLEPQSGSRQGHR